MKVPNRNATRPLRRVLACIAVMALAAATGVVVATGPAAAHSTTGTAAAHSTTGTAAAHSTTGTAAAHSATGTAAAQIAVAQATDTSSDPDGTADSRLGVVDVMPPPGSLLEPGSVELAATLLAGTAVTGAVLRLDGVEIPSSLDGATVRAVADVRPGRYLVEVEASTGAGPMRRSWEFAVDGAFLEIERIGGYDNLDGNDLDGNDLDGNDLDGNDLDGNAAEVVAAVAISRDRHPHPQSTAAAVIVPAGAFAEAAAAAPFALRHNAPLLLSGPSYLDDATAAELRRVVQRSAPVFVLGSSEQLGTEVESMLAEEGFRPIRLAGDTPFATAVALAEAGPHAAEAIVVSVRDRSAALAASSPAARFGRPILFTEPDHLPDVTRQYLLEANLDSVVLVGGADSLAPTLLADLEAVAGAGRVGWLGGSTPHHAAARVGEHYFAHHHRHPGDPRVVAVVAVEAAGALAAGPHAASRGAPILVADGSGLPDVHLAQLQHWLPSTALVYGSDADAAPALEQLAALRAGEGGPELVRMLPGEETVPALTEILLEFDRELVPERSTVHVMLDGREVPGMVSMGDFRTQLVYSPLQFPPLGPVTAGHELRIIVAATAGAGWTHLERTVVHAPASPLANADSTVLLRRGDRGDVVANLQHVLNVQRYWAGPVDGIYGLLTEQAVMAFQLTHGLPATGMYDTITQQFLLAELPPPPPRTTEGMFYEVDLTRQILMFVVDGTVGWTFNTSTGHGEWYTFRGEWYQATTTSGVHRIVDQVDGMVQAARGQLWRPKYYDLRRGIAFHGSSHVPAHNVSAGCLRVTNAAMDFLWELDPTLNAGVWVYPEDFYG